MARLALVNKTTCSVVLQHLYRQVRLRLSCLDPGYDNVAVHYTSRGNFDLLHRTICKSPNLGVLIQCLELTCDEVREEVGELYSDELHLKKLLGKLHSLQRFKLTVQGTSYFDPAFLNENLPATLQHLDLDFCEINLEQAVGYIALPNLKFLRIEHCVRYSSLDGLPPLSQDHLETFEINIDADALRNFLTHVLCNRPLTNFKCDISPPMNRAPGWSIRPSHISQALSHCHQTLVRLDVSCTLDYVLYISWILLTLI